MWWQKNKWKILVPLLVAAVLTGSFFLGGRGTDGRGASAAPQTDAAVPASQPESAAPSEAAQSAASQQPAASSDTGAPSSSAPLSQEAASSSSEASPAASSSAPVSGAGPEASSAPAAESEPASSSSRQPESAPSSGNGAKTCTISISCASILNNMDALDPDKTGLVPGDGWLLAPTEAEFSDGESVFDVLQRACREKGIQMEFAKAPAYGTAYIEGIGNLYEFDCGELSGWMYSVNGSFPNFGSSKYALAAGDTVAWVYTCDLGADVGGDGAAGQGRQ